MAGVDDKELLRFAGFPKGIDNVSPEQSVPSGALRAAVNVVLDDAGKPARRPGFVKVVDVDGIHSLYSDPRVDFMLAVTDAGLCTIDDTLTFTPIAPVSRLTAPMHYETGEFHILCGNGLENFRIGLDGELTPLSPPQPAGQPTVTANPAAGGLTAGTYQVAITFIMADGRESGSTLAAVVDVPENGGIALSNFPFDANAAATAIYMTHPNGDTLYQYEVSPNPMPVSRLLSRRELGRQLDTQFLVPLPGLQNLALANGRLHGSYGRLHIWSEALNYGLTNQATNYAMYNDDITLIARMGDASQSGMYLAAGKRTYYMDGPTPAQWQRVVAHPHGAIPGSRIYVEASELGLDIIGVVPVWMDTRGEMVAGLPGGRIARLHKDTYVGPEFADTATAQLVSMNGSTQLLMVAQGGLASNSAAFGDSVDAEICRNGVVVG